MKFQSLLDVQTFLTEIGAFSRLSEGVDKDYKPTDEELESFIRTRSEYVGKMKNYRRSAQQKANWRDNRTKMMKGIKAFHKSTEGKRFHRKLGRFLASRITRSKNESRGYAAMMEQMDFLVGLNSVKQHLYVEMDFFHQAQEQIELEEMLLDYSIPLFQTIEKKIISNEDLTPDETTFILDLTEPQDVLQGIADEMKKPSTEIANIFVSISESLAQEGIAKEDQRFYPALVARLSEYKWETL